ncbi:hypothetical protein M3J09_008290 [Ascochyta lentis]
MSSECGGEPWTTGCTKEVAKSGAWDRDSRCKSMKSGLDEPILCCSKGD